MYFVSYAQETAFLKKYSYLCFGLDNQNKKISSGTCYFYKKGTSTILITNYHVVSGISSANDSIINKQIDTLYFTCDSNEMIVTQSVTVPKLNARHALFYEKTDLIGIGIPLSKGNSVNYINDLIDTSYLNKKPDSVYLYGYPTSQIKTDGKVISSFSQQLVSGKYSDSFKFDFIPVFKTPNSKTSMSEDEIITKLRNTEFTIDKKSYPGQSGSPIFGRFKVDKTWVYKFIGMLWGEGNKDFIYSMAYKGLVIYQNLNR